MYAGKVAEEGPVRAGVHRAAAPVHAGAARRRSRTSTPTGGRSTSSRACRRTCATRRRAAGSRRAARSRWTSAARSCRPRSRSPTASASRATCTRRPTRRWPARRPIGRRAARGRRPRRDPARAPGGRRAPVRRPTLRRSPGLADRPRGRCRDGPDRRGLDAAGAALDDADLVAGAHRRGAGPDAGPDGRRRGAPPARGPRGPLPDPGRPAVAASPAAVVRAVDGIDLTIRKGEILGARRRVGLGQDDDRPRRREADPPDRRPDRLRRRGRVDAVGRQGAARVPAARPADLPGPVRDAEPEAHDRRVRRGAARRQQASATTRKERDALVRRARVRGPAPGRGLRRAAIRTSCPAASGSAS